MTTLEIDSSWDSEECLEQATRNLCDWLGSDEGNAFKAELRSRRRRIFLGGGNIFNGDDAVFYIDGRGLRNSCQGHLYMYDKYDESPDNSTEIHPRRLLDELKSRTRIPSSPFFIELLQKTFAKDLDDILA